MMGTCNNRVLPKIFGILLIASFLVLHTSAFSYRSIQDRGDTLGSSSTVNDETRLPTTKHQCQFCDKTFGTRNALFRHLNTDQSCSSEFLSFSDTTVRKDHSLSHPSMTKVSLFLKISYTLQFQRTFTGAPSDSSSESIDSVFRWRAGCKNPSDAHEIGQKVQEAIKLGLFDLFGGPNLEAAYGNTPNRDHISGKDWIVGTTQTSVANHRPLVLAQENGISSAADYLLVNLQMPQGEMEGCNEVDKLLTVARNYLGDDFETSSGSVYNLKILNGMRLPAGFAFHAEKECTQRVYHYLLPLSWLPDGALLESWCRNYDDQAKPAPPSDALARLREALQLAESTSIPNRKVRRRQSRSANYDSDLIATPNPHKNKKIRKGSASFDRKERIPWHNFGHVELRGDASPNQEPIWNVLDKARIKGFLLPSGFEDADETLVVLEFRGDNFVPGQIQSIVGTSVAVVHGWLPSDIFSMALSKAFLLETPSSPNNRLYCAGARFHSHESKLAAVMQNDDEGQVQTFEALEYDNPETALQATQAQVLERSGCFKSSAMDNDKQWLEELKHSISPRIKEAMLRLKEQHVGGSGTSIAIADSLPTLEECVQEQCAIVGRTTHDMTAPVQAYQRTLFLLRELITTGSWPETSMARSNVICEGDTQPRNNAGSFTVFNTEVPHNPLLNSMETIHQAHGTIEQKDVSKQSLPLGNQKFPELVESVFELEQVLIESGMLHQKACLDGSPTAVELAKVCPSS
ncbi:unnamed protein product [Cylindrotheca closterium]|uniref:Uncharacterized protein n=1 Tax=Cylindrotheca closterium TaxID=2856 RepID=A0AAD2G6J0_9STRA|nr:unnamed protein product [Cylindrotheca closterium]